MFVRTVCKTWTWYKHATRTASLVGYSVVDKALGVDDKLSTDLAKGAKPLAKESDKTIQRESITLPVEIGDTLLMGKFKNKKTVVKSIGKDEHGMPTINGKKVATFRIIKRVNIFNNESIINEIPMDDLQQIDKYADKQLNPMDVVITDKHFFDRLTDPRNGKEISAAELTGFFKRLGKNKPSLDGSSSLCVCHINPGQHCNWHHPSEGEDPYQS